MGQIPINTLHLFPILDNMLIKLLTSLKPGDWDKPTLAGFWTVKDIAAHLLDGNVRAISDDHQYQPPITAQINSYTDLVNYLNQLNAIWVNAMKRVSPQLLIQQLELTGKGYVAYLNKLQPFEQAKFSVAWAGESTSLNWFHIAREYTEKWHHQQQIREALGVDGLMTKELFYPCISIFMYALPHTFKNVIAKTDTVIKITISGEQGGDWYLQKDETKWYMADTVNFNNIATTVIIQPQNAWKFFTKALSPQQAINSSLITGDLTLGKYVFNAVAVMA